MSFAFVMNHCGNRLFEWCMALALMLLGVEIFLWPNTIAQSNFRIILDLIDAPNLALIYFTVGHVRVLGLVANGTYWPEWTPRIRAFGALAGAVIWGQMTIALFMLTSEVGRAPSPGIPVYFVLTLGELFSCYRVLARDGDNGVY